MANDVYQCQLYWDTTLVSTVTANEETMKRDSQLEFTTVFDFSHLESGTRFNKVVIIKNDSPILEKTYSTKTFHMTNKHIRYRISASYLERVGIVFESGVGMIFSNGAMLDITR